MISLPYFITTTTLISLILTLICPHFNNWCFNNEAITILNQQTIQRDKIKPLIYKYNLYLKGIFVTHYKNK